MGARLAACAEVLSTGSMAHTPLTHTWSPCSIAMIHRQSRGQLPLFVRGLERFKSLRAGDKVLVAEVWRE